MSRKESSARSKSLPVVQDSVTPTAAPHFVGVGNSATSHPSYIVGIGASAGGLEALERFFDHMPPDSVAGSRKSIRNLSPAARTR